ncbi:MAG: hypothetical protein U1E48_09960 [Paracoccaceae bacterium]
MPTTRLVLILAFVVLAVGATLALAYAVAGEIQPGWMAALGPLLLIATLVAHFTGRKNK